MKLWTLFMVEGQIKPQLEYDDISFYKLMCDMQETYFVNLECTLTYHSVT
jgi:hypothetical protein